MKKFFLIMFVIMLISCNNKNKTKESENKTANNNITAQRTQKETSSTEEINKRRLETEAEYEKDLMKINTEGYDNFKDFTDNDVKEVKKVIQKRFPRAVVTAVTNDGRFFVMKLIKDGKNKKETAKEVIIDRVDIIDTIGEWCQNNGLKYKFIIVEFFDLDKKEAISKSMYYSYILENIFESEEYKQEFSEAFDKYKRTIRY